MKKIALSGITVIVLLLAGGIAAYAGYGNGPGSGQCPSVGSGQCLSGTCSGPVIACSGAVETITGAVAAYSSPGNGMVVDTGTTIESLYGIGPVWYWERNAMDRPEIGETITANVETVTIGDRTVKVIISVTIDGQTLPLRDTSTCVPLWRGRR